MPIDPASVPECHFEAHAMAPLAMDGAIAIDEKRHRIFAAAQRLNFAATWWTAARPNPCGLSARPPVAMFPGAVTLCLWHKGSLPGR
jgi:hypothetical protein